MTVDFVKNKVLGIKVLSHAFYLSLLDEPLTHTVGVVSVVATQSCDLVSRLVVLQTNGTCFLILCNGTYVIGPESQR